MPRTRAADWGLWTIDHVLPVAGLTLLLLGATGRPLVVSLAWTALGLSFFGWVAEADGLARPRPGRTPIRTYGCWDTPLAFTVRRRGAVLLFSRDEDPERGGWSDEYTIRERPVHTGADPRWDLPVTPASGWRVLGRTPVLGLRFEHHDRVSYVTLASLERALTRAAGA
jgi:hypothetical protein